MNVIFGSGVIGLLAKHILGSDWKVIPFARSRFFTWNPALDDNFITSHDELDPFIKEITNAIGPPEKFQYKCSWSVGGEILHKFDESICDDWLNKIFSNNPPGQARIFMKDRMDMSVYGVRTNALYLRLVNQYIKELKEESEKGAVTEIGSHYFVRNGKREDFDNSISTIPLNILYDLMNIKHDLSFKPINYVHVNTSDLNFEGANQLLVSDGIIDFFKATNIAKDRYLLYFNRDVVDYGVYLMNFIQKFDILDGTAIADAIPIGQTPKLNDMEDSDGIFCVGSYAQWDWCSDVGSCILRLLRYYNRGFKQKQQKNLI